MNFENCKLYNLKRKRDLFKLLNTNKKEINDIKGKYSPYIKSFPKPRLIEPTYNETLKYIQNCINNIFSELEFDSNVFGAIKGVSYLDNGKYHLNHKYIVALDISKFFPNTSRDKIYNFFKNKLKCSPDVSKILTDLCSVNLANYNNKKVFNFIKEKGIKHLNHLTTGACYSSILSYLVNIDMFQEITRYCENNNCKVSFFIDDIVISSNKYIKNKIIKYIERILNLNGYSISKDKLKRYNSNEYKRVTGAIISKDSKRLVYPNKIRYKIAKISKDKNINTNVFKGLKQVLKQIDLKNMDLEKSVKDSSV